MSRLISLVLVGLFLSACAGQVPAPRQASGQRSFRLPTTDEYMVACVGDTRRVIDFFDLTETLLGLSKISFSEQYKEKLLQSYGRRLERFQAGERLPRRSEKEEKTQPTPGELTKAREELKAIQQMIKEGKSAEAFIAKSLESRDSDSYFNKGHLTEEAVLEIAKKHCTKRLMEFTEEFSLAAQEALKEIAIPGTSFNLEGPPRYQQPQRQHPPLSWEMPQPSQPYQRPQLRYNPFSQAWSYEDPGSQLHFNPFQRRWEYAHPQAQPRYNPFSGKWEVK